MAIALILLLMVSSGLLMYFIAKIGDYMSHKIKHHHKEPHEECGSLTITGEGELSIELPSSPDEVEVLFCDDGEGIPCNTTHDILEWKLEHLETPCPKLKIIWSVAGAREIEWKIKF